MQGCPQTCPPVLVYQRTNRGVSLLQCSAVVEGAELGSRGQVGGRVGGSFWARFLAVFGCRGQRGQPLRLVQLLQLNSFYRSYSATKPAPSAPPAYSSTLKAIQD